MEGKDDVAGDVVKEGTKTTAASTLAKFPVG